MPNIIFWGNRKDGQPPFEYSITEEARIHSWKNIRWIFFPKPGPDIAASIIPLDIAKDDISFVRFSDFVGIEDLSKGEDVYYLGFPQGLGSVQGTDPMLRRGMVSLKESNQNLFYIDATVAGGNSGGPVFKPKTSGRPGFIGIVTAFIPAASDKGWYHSGIGIVYPVNYIKQLLESKEFEATK